MSEPKEPRRIIIRNESNLDLVTALELVQQVVEDGLVSGEGTASGPQHCYATRFSFAENKPIVWCKKNPSGSETFIVYRD